MALSHTESKGIALCSLPSRCRQYVKDGETWWMLERNSAAAGFFRVEDYLKWRHADQVVADGVVS